VELGGDGLGAQRRDEEERPDVVLGLELPAIPTRRGGVARAREVVIGALALGGLGALVLGLALVLGHGRPFLFGVPGPVGSGSRCCRVAGPPPPRWGQHRATAAGLGLVR